MSEHTSSQAVAELLEGLDFSSFSMAQLVKRLEQLRERPISIFPITIADPQLYGAWVKTLDYDCICLDKQTSRVHQNHILCHELGHIVLGHSTLNLPIQIQPYVQTHSAEELQQTLEQALSQDGVLKRSCHASDAEQAAEAFATTLQNELIRRVGLHALTSTVASLPVWSELAQGLGLKA